jgi:glycosyltransferase involved in cell wall biosynthesis
MAGAELFVMPSRLEPFGIVVLEAWRAGVAVVATTHGGPPEFVHDGHDGVLVDPFDTGNFAVVLQKLLSDADHRRALAEAGRLSAEAFAWPSIARRYQQVYSSVIGTGTGEGGVDAPRSRSHQGESVR